MASKGHDDPFPKWEKLFEELKMSTVSLEVEAAASVAANAHAFEVTSTILNGLEEQFRAEVSKRDEFIFDRTRPDDQSVSLLYAMLDQSVRLHQLDPASETPFKEDELIRAEYALKVWPLVPEVRYIRDNFKVDFVKTRTLLWKNLIEGVLKACHTHFMSSGWSVLWLKLREVEDVILSTPSLSAEEDAAFKLTFERLCKKRGRYAVRPLLHVLASADSGKCNDTVLRTALRVIAECGDHSDLFKACKELRATYAY